LAPSPPDGGAPDGGAPDGGAPDGGAPDGALDGAPDFAGVDLAGVDFTVLPPRYVFLLPPATGALGLEPSLDAACTAAASPASLPGSYAAVIVSPTTEPFSYLSLKQG